MRARGSRTGGSARKWTRAREQLFVTVSGLSRSIISRKVLLTALIFCPPLFSCFLVSPRCSRMHSRGPPTLRSAAPLHFFLQSLIVMLVHFGGLSKSAPDRSRRRRRSAGTPPGYLAQVQTWQTAGSPYLRTPRSYRIQVSSHAKQPKL